MSHLEQADAVATTSGEDTAQSQMHKEVFDQLESKFSPSSSLVQDQQVEKIKTYLADAQLTPVEARSIAKMLLRNDQNLDMTKVEQELNAKLKESGSSFELEIKPQVVDGVQLTGITLELKDGRGEVRDKDTVKVKDGKVLEPSQPIHLKDFGPGKHLPGGDGYPPPNDITKEFANAALDGDLTAADARAMTSYLQGKDGVISGQDVRVLERQINDQLEESGSNYRVDIDASMANIKDIGSVSYDVSDVTDPQYSDHVAAPVDNTPRPIRQVPGGIGVVGLGPIEGGPGTPGFHPRPIGIHPLPIDVPGIHPPGGKPIGVKPIGGKPIKMQSE